MTILQPKQTLIFEGDSMTRRSVAPCADNWPLVPMNNWNPSWADLVEEWIFAHRPDLQIKCRQTAIGGSSIIDLDHRYEEQVKPHRPAWIFLTLGSNDCNACDIPVKVFRERFATYVSRAQTDSGARFFYAGGFLPMPGLVREEIRRIERCQDHYETARGVVRASGGLAPEIAGPLKHKAEQHFAASTYHTFYSDGVHLNALGNHVLAALLLEALGVFRVSGESSTSHLPTIRNSEYDTNQTS